MITRVVLAVIASWASFPAFAQPAAFTAVEIRASAPNTMPQMRARFGNGRYELRNATAVDLIRTAWGVEADDIAGGADWLDLNRYDVVAAAPANSTPQMLRSMLQGLLKDRFQLSIRNGEKERPAYAITAGKKPQLEAADGAGTGGCKLRPFSSGPSRCAATPCDHGLQQCDTGGLRQDSVGVSRSLGLRVQLPSAGSVRPDRSLELQPHMVASPGLRLGAWRHRCDHTLQRDRKAARLEVGVHQGGNTGLADRKGEPAARDHFAQASRGIRSGRNQTGRSQWSSHRVQLHQHSAGRPRAHQHDTSRPDLGILGCAVSISAGSSVGRRAWTRLAGRKFWRRLPWKRMRWGLRIQGGGTGLSGMASTWTRCE